MSNVGRKIAGARFEANLNKSELARQLGVSEATVRSYESGRTQPSIEILRKIAEITDKPVAYFYGEDDKSKISMFKPGEPTEITIQAPREIAEAISEAISRQFDQITNPSDIQHPGVEELIADTARCQRLNATQKQLEKLRRIIIPGHRIENIFQAEDMLRLIQNLEREGQLSSD